ncbi:FxSxx-COOH system tetratricopeptide repeat protein [Streptomyces sp. NBC_01615]|uniref:FxSxx-COOH system tetratricopeptide repeat protein n=1 Tax=Streptomyces sp. NBC_01615 TaxID=2975898 RepID=UPI003868DF3C
MSSLFERRPGVAASGESAVAAGGNIAQAITGSGAVGLHIDTDTLTMLSPEAYPSPDSVDCPPGLANLPERAPLFVARSRELALLDTALSAPGQAVVHAVHGLGGIGKSTLAARWAAEFARGQAPVWWITADSRAAVDTGLAGLAAALRPSLVTLLPQEQLGEWALQWLASHTGWLLVLDNVSDPADVKPLLARATSGRFLITSRRAGGWQGIAEPVALDVLSVEDAVELFTRKRGDTGNETDVGAGRDGVAEVCEELGCLPLAVAQAAAYCDQTSSTAREYLTELAAHPAHMYAATEEGGDNERTIARIWHLTLDRLSDDPLAGTILLTLAWYASDGIPRSLLNALGPSYAVRTALGRLKAHSMITLYEDTVSVHRLVQAVSRTPDDDRHRSPEAIAHARETATQTLADALPPDVGDPSAWPVMRALLPHVEALAEAASPRTDTVAMARLLTRTGDYMLSAGTRLAPRALSLLTRAEADCVRLHGPEAVETLDARTELAHAHRMGGDVDSAVRIGEQTLADCQRVLGSDHELTLLALTNAAKLAIIVGDTERGLRLTEEALAGCRRVLGEDHPHTFAVRNTMVMHLVNTGDLARGRSTMQELLADCVRALGDEHPQTLSTGALAVLVAQAPDYMAGSADLARIALAARKGGNEDLGAAMRGFLEKAGTVGNSLPLPRVSEEDVAQAEEKVATCVRVFGEDHVNTLAVRMGLLGMYATTQDERYVERFQRLVVEMFSALGEDHPLTIEVLGMLEALNVAVNDLPEDMRRSLGIEDGTTDEVSTES